MQEIQFIQAWALVAIARITSDRDERGATVVEYVIMTAIAAAATIAIGTAIFLKFTNKANTIPTE